MRKKPFLLLEILIAISLILLCIVPLVVKPLQFFQAEKNLLWEMEGERLADWTFSEIKEQLLKNEIPWAKLPKDKRTSKPFRLNDGKISIPGSGERSIRREFTLHCKKEHEGFNGEVYRMFTVQISFAPRLGKKEQYEYRLMARKLLEQKEKVQA